MIEKNEIDALRQENENLKSELNAYKLIANCNASVEEFYGNKLLNEINKVKTFRLQILNDKLDNLNKEKMHFTEELDSFDITTFNNSEYEEELKDIDLRLNAFNKEISLLKNEYEEVHFLYKKKQAVLEQATLDYYQTILNVFNQENVDIYLVSSTVDFVIKQLEETLYNLILECRDLNFKDNKKYLQYEDKVSETKKEVLELKNRKEEILSKIKNQTKEDLKYFEEDINSEISELEQIYQELDKTFEVKKNEYLNQLLDILKYQKILDKPKDLTAKLAEEFIQNAVTTLSSVDTIKNLKISKQIKLSKLKEQKIILDKKQKELTYLVSTKEDLNLAILNIEDNTNKLFKYIEDANHAIDDNSSFSNTIKCYNNLKKEQLTIKQAYDEESKKLDVLIKEKDKYTKETSKDVESFKKDFANTTIKVNELSKKQTELNDEIRKIRNTPENLRLLSVVDSKEFIEARLPKIYEDLRSLKEKLFIINTRIDELNKMLVNYNQIVDEIVGIENELKD